MHHEERTAQSASPGRGRICAGSRALDGVDRAERAREAVRWVPAGAARERLAFLRGFLSRPSEVGSVVPSSSSLEQHLVRWAGLSNARCVVELGPGTGGTTRAFLRAMPADARLLAIELSLAFHARLAAAVDDVRLIPQLGSAESIADFLSAWRLPAPQVIVSGIPFSTMPVDTANRIARSIAAVLAPGGRFVAYQFRPHVARFMSPYLGTPDLHWQWVNIPPVRVFTWTKR
jgi:phospholipid N-methyltransferase